MTRAPLLAVLVVAGFFAYINGSQLAFAVVYAGVLLVVAGLAWSWWAVSHVSCQRQAGGGDQMAGRTFSQRFTVENHSRLPISLLEVRDLAPFPGYQGVRGVSLGPRQRLSWESQVRLAARGRYQLGPTEVRASDPFGVFTRTVRFAADGSLLVYPAVRAIPDLAPLGERSDYDSGRSRPLDLPPAASGIREHEPADGINRIHWVSTARRGRLMSRTFDAGAGADLLLVLDLCRGLHRGVAPESSLEYAVSAAASAACQALEQGRSVSLLTTDLTGKLLPPARGLAQRRLVLEALALVQDDGRARLVDVLARQLPTWRSKGGVLVFTSDVSGEWVEVLAASSSAGRRPGAVLVDAGSFQTPPVPTRVPASWRLVMDVWTIRRGGDLSRMDRWEGRAVG